MGKTIKQIADELGVSKQAVHQKRKSAALSTALQPFTTTVDGVVYISVDGEKLIKQAFLKNSTSTNAVNEFTPVDGHSFTPVDGQNDRLYSILEKELAAKDKQIERLQGLLDKQIEINKELAQSINADRKNELAGTLKEFLPEGGEPESQDEVTVDAEPVINKQERNSERLDLLIPPTRRNPNFLQRCKNAWRDAVAALKGELPS